MTDQEFAEAFEKCELPKELFHHRDHLRLAWIYLQRYGSTQAEARISESIRRYAAHLGVSEKYHETITVAWLRLVRQASDCAPRGAGFVGVLAACPHLLKQDALREYYSGAALESERARHVFVEPDLKALPGG
jgi:hypothetical protein